MPKEDDDFSLLLGAAIIGVGALVLAGALLQSNEDTRQNFRSRLQNELAERGLDMVSATFGRGPDARPFWEVTLRSTNGRLHTHRIPLNPLAEPHSDETRGLIAAEVLRRAAA